MTVLPFWPPFLLNASAFGRDAWTQPVHTRGHCHTRADPVTRACGHARERVRELVHVRAEHDGARRRVGGNRWPIPVFLTNSIQKKPAESLPLYKRSSVGRVRVARSGIAAQFTL